ncbi:hypothetical protein PGT21_023034 [Puccinia graminis f. sp. tritici]|uniref:Transcription initiation factor TFIID subunit 4 n=1 Tax=Puccinia graminis f. sp. tritici TaxID=56615 RepID=A0A5B0M2Y8_PUCGR|nr:hypothetical protein PGT21_023034 [Puccinia graminis f. sp. tritici]KAA1125726.1 hypothetical protein PGTUg99_007598 [Puccinia graminis f. sp. tritici]
MNSPTSKRSKLDSPLQQQQQSNPSSHSWKSNQNNTQNNQFTNKLGLAGLSNPNDSNVDDHRPSASGSGSFAAGSTHNYSNVQTDFDAMNDAVGIAGVDIAAEEELARTQSTLYRTANRNYSIPNLQHQQLQQPWLKTPRVKIMDFLDKPALTLMVQHIAASFQLKTLEPAILDVLTQAAEARLHSLIVDSIGAKDHRLGSTHLRAPPLYASSVPKGKQKEREPGAMYDQVVYEDPERILSMLARVEGEEERKARLEREAMEGEGEGGHGHPDTAGLPSGGGGLGLGETAGGAGGGGGGGQGEGPEKAGPMKKEKKRKREGPGQLARNMSEDARARQSNQTAMRSVGGRSKYSWLSGGVVSGGANKPLPSTFVASLPAPKFAPSVTPASNSLADHHPSQPTTNTLNRPSTTTTTTSSSTTSSSSTTTPSLALPVRPNNKKDQTVSLGPSTSSSRLAGPLPPKHLATTSSKIGIKDCLFALERERGTGAGKGTGSKTLFKAYLNPNHSVLRPLSNPSNSAVAAEASLGNPSSNYQPTDVHSSYLSGRK